MALNPALTYFDSYNFFKFEYFSEPEAIAEARKQLQIFNKNYKSPLARRENLGNSVSVKKNLVIVLMESMSANRMGVFGHEKNITPFLDSLALKSTLFSNFYSCGIHTCNGILGALYGFPTLFAEHPLSNEKNSHLDFGGLPGTLKSKGYTNLFFCPHFGYFDNMNNFLGNNGFDRMYAVQDYPPDEVVNNWGVPDDFLFQYSIPKMDSLAAMEKPFFTTILTISTHPPYELPSRTKFKSQHKEMTDQVFEYADWSIRNFIEGCSKKSWYNNTVFVFLGDHGISTYSQYEAPLSSNHVPLIIFNPSNSNEGRVEEGFGNQTDVFPTVMHILGFDYVNNSMGINLFNQNRPYTYFTQDNKLCVLNNDYYLIINKSGFESFYILNGKQLSNEAKKKQIEAMKSYAYCMLQTTQIMETNFWVGIEK